MAYKKDINKLVREKNRLGKIKDNIGNDSWSLTATLKWTSEAKQAKNLVSEAIQKLHEAEIILRNY